MRKTHTGTFNIFFKESIFTGEEGFIVIEIKSNKPSIATMNYMLYFQSDIENIFISIIGNKFQNIMII